MHQNTKIEEHGFIARGSKPMYSEIWHNSVKLLAHDIREYMISLPRYKRYQTLCQHYTRLIRLYVVKGPKGSKDCTKLSRVEQLSWVLRHLNNEFKGSKHPMETFLINILQQPILAYIPKTRFGPYKVSLPFITLQTPPSHILNRFVLRKFQFTDIHGSYQNSSKSFVSFVIPSHRGDVKESFLLMFQFDWDNPKHNTFLAFAINLCQYLTTVEWNSRDILVVIADNKALYAGGTVSSNSIY